MILQERDNSNMDDNKHMQLTLNKIELILSRVLVTNNFKIFTKVFLEELQLCIETERNQLENTYSVTIFSNYVCKI